MGIWLLGLEVKDASHTFRAFRQEVPKKVMNGIRAKGHPSFELEYTFKTAKQGFKICEIPVIFIENRASGVSKINIPKEFFDFLRCIIDLRLR